jgi:DNA modification methylase
MIDSSAVSKSKLVLHDVATPFPLPDGCVQTCVTSPPYFNLRDYADAGSDWPEVRYRPVYDASEIVVAAEKVALGGEKTPAAFIGHLLHVFREVRRVLRGDGTLWVNLGDSYAPNWSSVRATGGAGMRRDASRERFPRIAGLPSKNLIGIPWRFALAMQADGWFLRSDVIWHKPSCMPEPVTDRCTRNHEYLFLFTKSDRYYYDAEAVKEQASQPGRVRADRFGGEKYTEGVKHSDGSVFTGADTRNRRSVWTINPKPFKGAHFATFPPKLVEVPILAGTSLKGCCPTCGAPWRRTSAKGRRFSVSRDADGKQVPSLTSTAWERSCGCPEATPVPCIVLDPFSGSGTTAIVAERTGRRAIGFEKNPKYLKLSKQRRREDRERRDSTKAQLARPPEVRT